jgi:hypothetical protein
LLALVRCFACSVNDAHAVMVSCESMIRGSLTVQRPVLSCMHLRSASHTAAQRTDPTANTKHERALCCSWGDAILLSCVALRCLANAAVVALAIHNSQRDDVNFI